VAVAADVVVVIVVVVPLLLPLPLLVVEVFDLGSCSQIPQRGVGPYLSQSLFVQGPQVRLFHELLHFLLQCVLVEIL
jgi:hypothetical protein